jgi:hypothetical protein
VKNNNAYKQYRAKQNIDRNDKQYSYGRNAKYGSRQKEQLATAFV